MHAGIDPATTPAGFRFSKGREQCYLRRVEGAVQRIYVPLIDYNPLFEFSFAVGIRIDEVEASPPLLRGAPG